MDRTLAYEAGYRGSNPLGSTEWSSGRCGHCGGLKIRRSWIETNLLHNMVMIVQMVRTPDCGSGGREFESRSSPKQWKRG